MNQMFLTQRRKTFIVTNKRGEQGKKAKMSLSQVEHYTIFCLFLWAEKKCSFAAIVFILYDFSVAKATLELQMSHRPSVCLSQKPLSLSELLVSTIKPIGHRAYQPLSLSTIKPINL